MSRSSSNSPRPPASELFLRRTVLVLFGLMVGKLIHEWLTTAWPRTQAGTPRSPRLKLWTLLLDRVWQPLTTSPFPTVPHLPDLPQLILPTLAFPTASELPAVRTPLDRQGLPIMYEVGSGVPIRCETKQIQGVSLFLTTIQLQDPETFITIGLANNAPMANSRSQGSYGDERFTAMLHRYPAALVTSGTFFGTDVKRWVMGNLLAGGRVLKYSRWENYGTTLGLKSNNEPELVTSRADGKPNWREHWFSLTAGPRLLRQGRVWLSPRGEGFRDPQVLGVAYRSAIGFPAQGDRLFLVTFNQPLSLTETAQLMRAIGCSEAMNLDGGSSQALAYRGKVLVQPGRNLTNVIVVYDTQNPAPKDLIQAWYDFQLGKRPPIAARSFFPG